MKVPLGWLRDYVDLPESAARLAERLTLAGLEVLGVRLLGLPAPEGLHVKAEDAGPVWDRDRILVGQVVNVERHPNADRLTLATVEYGAGEPKTVVTGAPNLKVGDRGQKVVVALTGSVLYDGHANEKTLRELKPGKIRGIASDAMVCSAYELGITDEHEGILLLDEDAPVGKALVDYMGDVVFEIDVTPNLARCLSMIGVAREVAALTGKELRLPREQFQASGAPIEGRVDVAIEDPKQSARYAAAIITGVRAGPSPGWMQRRLAYAGMRPINCVVDVTNYVMLEWGQPLHAFDFDSLIRRAHGATPLITVRRARAGESLRTLDNIVQKLTPEMLVIADTAGPIALAGVMGGAETEVHPGTSNILMESASFDPVAVRGTMKAFNLPSEASARFSRGVHPELVRPAVERAAEMLRHYADGVVSRGLAEAYPAPPRPTIIDLDMGEVARCLGIDIPADEAAGILRSLHFQVEALGAGKLRVTVPAHRLDVQAGAADLIEELARIRGYDRLPATLLADRLPEQHPNRSLELEERVRDILVDLGLQEAITYSLTEPSRETALGNGQNYVRLVNPISSERVVMRHHVLTGVLEAAAANLRHTEEVLLFEVGPVFLQRVGQRLPDEPRRLALLMTGKRGPGFWREPSPSRPALDFYDLKGVVEGLVLDLHVPASFRPATAAHLHPGRAAEMFVDGRSAGVFGEMHPSAAEAYGLGSRTVLTGELDLELLLAAVPAWYAYAPVPRFPAALRDVAVIVEENVPADRVEREIAVAGKPLLASARLFDLYRGSSIPAGKKSLAYALTYQAPDRTLTDKEVDRAHKKIEDRLKHVLRSQIRGHDGPG